MSILYRNEYLFSEIYLQEITQLPESTEILASLATLREYREYAQTDTLEAWKNSFVHEVLYALRFGLKAIDVHVTLLYPVGQTDQPISLCYVVPPSESLDNTLMGRNWAERIIRSLRQRNLRWGLLTNGEQWRIYHANEPTPYETYLEIDLAAILVSGAKGQYQIFFKFMKAENFVEDKEGRCQFDVFKKQSQDKIDYIENELANALKQREEGGKGVLSSLCMGYVQALRARGGASLDDDSLPDTGKYLNKRSKRPRYAIVNE